MLNYIWLGHALVRMNRCFNHTLTLAVLLFVFVATVVSPLAAQTTNKPPANPPPPQSPARLEWNAATLSLIQSNGYYGRIIRLKNGQMLCGFDFERKIWVRHSANDGRTWQKSVEVAAWPFGRLTNTELLQLRNGSLLCFYNERPRPPSALRNQNNAPQTPVEAHPYAICMARSDDNGQTWQKPETLYRAGSEFTNGCWEPAAIELPSGEVQLFVSSEGPYRNSDEQEITLLRSTHGART